MKYKKIPYVEKEISRIVFGTAIDPFLKGQNMDELLDGVVKLGITTFDTARIYQGSESVIGNWMESRKCRDQVNILTKCGHPDVETGEKRVNRACMMEDLKISQEMLKTDYFDIYLLHRDDEEVPVGELVETFNEMHENGQIGAFGGSNWTTKRIAEANAYANAHDLIPFTVSSPNFGLAEQVNDLWGGGCTTISGPEYETDRKWYIENEIPVFAYSSLARGLFAGKIKSTERDRMAEILDDVTKFGYDCDANFERLARVEELSREKGYSVSQIAMAWLFCQPVDTFALCGSSNVKRMQENVEALDIELSEEEVRYLDLRG